MTSPISISQLYNCNSIYEHLLESSFLKDVIFYISSYVDEKIVITDSKFRIVFSNTDILKKGENIFNTLKLKKSHINRNSLNIKRSIIIDKKICPCSINIFKINSTENYGYLFCIKNNSLQKNLSADFADMINYLKHDLKTQLISQLMALKLVSKSDKYFDLLPEIIDSVDNSYRSLKTRLCELEYNNDNLVINRKEISIKNLTQNILSDCDNFIKLKNNQIKFIVPRNSKIHIDSSLLKDAFVNILYRVNNLCENNTEIFIKSDICHKMFRFYISFPYGKLNADFFEKQNELTNKFYNSSSCLSTAEKIIEAHSGKIKIYNDNKISFIRINLPK